MSSTSTMSRSLERPTTICFSGTMGNSPPWYFPLMKRRTNDLPGRVDDHHRCHWSEPSVRGLASLVESSRERPREPAFRAASPSGTLFVQKTNDLGQTRSSRGSGSSFFLLLPRSFRGVQTLGPNTCRTRYARLPPGGDPFGTHRALEPLGSLPQPAKRVDNDFSRLFAGEVLLQVETLNVDAASFRQMEEAAAANTPDADTAVARAVEETVRARGKQHNPVTGSGGMLLGRVLQLAPGQARCGDALTRAIASRRSCRSRSRRSGSTASAR